MGTFDPTTAVLADSPPSGFDPTTAKLADDDASTSEPSETAGRVAGLAGRAIAQGAGNLVDLPTKLIPLVDSIGKTVADHVRGALGLSPSSPVVDASGTDIATKAANKLSDAANLPTPQTPVERIGSSAVSALPSALLAPEAPITGLVSSALSGGASQAVAEGGGSPLEQTLAGVGAGLTPAGVGGLTRGLVRGTSGAAMAERTAAAADAGTNLTAGQASGNPALQKLESVSKAIWGGGPLKANADAQADTLGNAVDNIAAKLKEPTPEADLSKSGTGEVIQQGLTQTKATMRAAEKVAYDKVDALVPADTNVDISGSVAKAKQLAAPTGNAAVDSVAVSPKVRQITDAITQSVGPDGKLPYSAAVRLKSAVGGMIDDSPLAADPQGNAALKQIYGSLKGDVESAASAVSPEASDALTSANKLYKANQDSREFISTIIDKQGGPEKVYNAAMSGVKDGPTVIGKVMAALNPEQQNLVRAAQIKRLGSAVASKQDGAGEVFDPGTFLTRWNQMDPKAKDVMFGTSGQSGSLRSGLDTFVDTLSTMKSANALPNPSGSADKVGHLATLFEGLKRAMEVGVGAGGAAGAAHVAGAGAGLVSGATLAVPAGIGLNYAFAKAVTSPTVVRWLASTSKLPEAGRAAAIAQLGRMKDPDAQRLYQSL